MNYDIDGKNMGSDRVPRHQMYLRFNSSLL